MFHGKEGDLFRVHMKSNPSTGYNWYLANMDNQDGLLRGVNL